MEVEVEEVEEAVVPLAVSLAMVAPADDNASTDSSQDSSQDSFFRFRNARFFATLRQV